MKCNLVTLAAPTEEDFAEIAGWMVPTSPTSVLTGDNRERVTVETVRERYRTGASDYWVVTTTEDGRRIGVVQSTRIGALGTYSIGGAVVDPALWARGYGGAAFGHLVDHLFHQEAARRVQFHTAAFNRGMIESLTRTGFTLEGILRDAVFLDGEYHDMTLWSILRREFEEEAADERAAARYPLPDRVSSEDKRRARTALVTYLDRYAPATSWATFAARNDLRRSS